MATQLQDLQAKRKELQATNPNAKMLDAKNALAPAISNAPVAWVAPAVTNPVWQTTTAPTAPVAPVSVHDNANYQSKTTEQYNQSVPAKNKAKVQSEIQAWTRPAVGTQATPAQTPEIIQQAQTQTAQANTPAPATTETPTAPVTPTETETTPKTTTPVTTQVAAPVITPDSNSIYTNLRSNTPLPDAVKSTQAYKDAQARYNNFQKYASYDVNTLTTALSNGTILPGTSTWNDLMTDPVMWGKILQAKALTNWKWVDYVKTTQQASDNIVANSPILSWMLADWQITAEEWAQATNTPEVTAKMADVETKKNAYDTLKAKYDAVEDDVKKEYENKSVAGSYLDSIVADRRKAMAKELTIAWDTYNNALGTLTQLKQDASNKFETNMKLYQEQKAQENQYKMAQYQAQLGLATNQAKLQQEADFAKQQAYANINDPATAINNVMEEYKKLGIPFTTTLQSRLQEFANSGKSLPDYLTQMTESIQASPAYQAYKTKKDAEWVSFQTIWDKVYKVQNGQLIEQKWISVKSTKPSWKYDTNTGTWIDENTWVRPDIQALTQAKWQTLLDAPDGMVIPSRLSETTNSNGWKECAEYVNDITWIWLGNTWASKKAKIDDKIIVPEAWDTAIWIPDPSNKTFAKYGHAWIVTWVSEDESMVTIKSSNLNWDGAISTITVPISQIDQTWGFAKSSIRQTGTQSTEITPADISTYNSATFKPQTDLKTQAQKDKYKKFLQDKTSVMNNKDVDIQSILAYSAWWKELTDATIKPLEKFNGALDQIGSIQEQISKMDTWPILGRLRNLNPYDTDAQALKAQLTALMPTVARWVYGEVWVLTDNDIRLYAQTIPNLTNTNDVNNAVLAMSLKVIAWGYKRQLQTLAAAWKDVSGFSGIYDWLMNQVKSLESQVWINWANTQDTELDSLYNWL